MAPTMRFHHTPRPLIHLITTILLAPTLTRAHPEPHPSLQAGFSFNELFARYECSGTTCGVDGQYCCTPGQACYTDAANIAQCTASSGQATVAGGYWQYYTTIYTQTDLIPITSVGSSYVGGAASTGIPCNFANNEKSCGTICCASDQYCFQEGQCAPAAGGGSSGYYSSYTPMATAGAPIRPTSSGLTYVTETASPTTTVPFVAPVATGANITVTGAEQSDGDDGLSGGAIAGIVIGVLAGLLLLALLCFYCCIKGLFDTFLACIGLGKRRRRTEVDEYERHSHHTSHHGGRTWYGAAARPPARVDRREKKSSGGANLLGIGAGLAGLWAILGLKRRRNDKRRNDEKYSEYSYSSDYYTSASEY